MIEFVAVALIVAALVRVAVAPTLPGRRLRRGGPPLAHLSNGPLVVVESRVYPAARRSRLIDIITIVLGIGTIGCLILLAAGVAPLATTSASVAGAIMTATFAGANWFSGRVRLRIDQSGLHSRVFFREHTIRWSDIVDTYLRYVFLPGMGARLIYYCVRSSTREFAFPSSMAGASDLQATIESATGRPWPTPEITATM